MNTKRRIGVAAASIALLVAGVAGPASALTSTSTSTASCDSIYTNIKTVTTGGDFFSFKQLSSTHSSSTTVRISNGTYTYTGTVSTGGAAFTKSNFPAGKYTVSVKRSVEYQCNGAAAGNGNYSLDWLIQY